MNASVKSITGTFTVVRFVDADKLDQIAAILGLSDAEKASLGSGDVIIVTDTPPAP